MKMKLMNEELHAETIEQLERVTGEETKKCYQCGNCSAGCPVSYTMDFPPSLMIRYLQLGKYEEVLKATSMWTCVGCLQCFSRCPKSVSAAAIFEGLRLVTLRSGKDHDEVGKLAQAFIKKAPQQAIVCGFRKFVS